MNSQMNFRTILGLFFYTTYDIFTYPTLPMIPLSCTPMHTYDIPTRARLQQATFYLSSSITYYLIVPRKPPPIRTPRDDSKLAALLQRIKEQEALRRARNVAALYQNMTDKNELLRNLIQCYFCKRAFGADNGEIFFFNNWNKRHRNWVEGQGPCAKTCIECYTDGVRRRRYVKKYGLVVPGIVAPGGSSA
jgi:hypothetical protein